MNTAKAESRMTFGIQTAAIANGGPPSGGTATESFNGTSWTNTTSSSTSRDNAASCGTQALGAIFGGSNTANVAATEEWTGIALQTKTITVS